MIPLVPSLAVRPYWLLLGPLRSRTHERGRRPTLGRMKTVLEKEVA